MLRVCGVLAVAIENRHLDLPTEGDKSGAELFKVRNLQEVRTSRGHVRAKETYIIEHLGTASDPPGVIVVKGDGKDVVLS